MIFQTSKQRVNSEVKIDFKNRILGRSLLWMGLGLALIVLFAWATIQFPNFAIAISRIGDLYWLLFFGNILLIFGLTFVIMNPNRSLFTCVIFYFAFVLIQAIFTSITIVFSGIDLENFLLVLMIPGCIFLTMGLIAYFDWFDMTRLWPIAAFGSLALFIMSLVLLFVPSQTMQKWWLLLAAAIFIIYIGIDIQMVINLDRHQNLLVFNDQQMHKMTLMMGLILLIDFVTLLRIVLNLFINDR